MKVLIIGANGTIGSAVTSSVGMNHQVITAGRNSGDVRVDIESSKSIEAMFRQYNDLDAVICAAGHAKWGDLQELNEEDYHVGINSKLMGQVNLVRIGINYLKDNGSFTLTTGILAERPVKGSINASLVNGALHSFVLAASTDLPRGIRVNVVAAGLVKDSAEKMGHLFPGHIPVDMDKVGRTYKETMESRKNGEIVRIYE